jgi:hypothetical protein
MAVFNDTGYGTVTLGATVPQYARVTAAGALAGLADQHVGFTQQYGVSGNVVGMALISKQGTTKAIAATDVAVGAKVYTAANGKVSKTYADTSFLAGIAMEAAGADGDIIEIIPVTGEVAGSS